MTMCQLANVPFGMSSENIAQPISTLAYCHISTLFLHYSNSKYGYFRLSRSIFNTICPKNLLCSSEPG